MVWILASLCAAQSIAVRGTVKDRFGIGIGGATVKLEVATLSTTTAADGSFSLKGNLSGIFKRDDLSLNTVSPIFFKNGRLSVALVNSAVITITGYTLNGRQISSVAKMYGFGVHTILLPFSTTGLHIYKITDGQNVLTFLTLPGSIALIKRHVPAGYNKVPLVRQANRSPVCRDVIFVTKEGQINYRDSLQTYDTSAIEVKMIPNAGDVIDADGNVYQSVRIGSQVWTVENLRVTQFNDGTPIPNITNPIQWSSLTSSAFCYYNNDTVNKVSYGALYNWYAVTAGKISPEGWHVPSLAEWDTLQNYLIKNSYNWDGTTSDNKIAKALAARTDWEPSEETGDVGNRPGNNNSCGFSGLPGGYRNIDGDFILMGRFGNWWSMSKVDELIIYGRGLSWNSEGVRRSGDDKEDGFSIRLLRD